MSALTHETRRDLMDLIMTEARNWAGQMDEVAFLSRLFELTKLPSYDNRFPNASRDIWQHRVNNPDDWPDDWVFTDPRLDLPGRDDVFLEFLCQMLHPLVRRDDSERKRLAALFNEILRHDGWEVVPGRKTIGDLPVFVARPVAEDRRILAEAAEEVAFALDSDYVARQIQRMEAAVDSDPDLAIGTAKEFVETVAKSILDERDVEHEDDSSVTGLVRLVAEELSLVPDGIPDEAKASRSIKRVLGGLEGTVQGVAEVRNAYGTGHGKKATASGLTSRHAQLAVGAAITVCVFLYETHEQRD